MLIHINRILQNLLLIKQKRLVFVGADRMLSVVEPDPDVVGRRDK